MFVEARRNYWVNVSPEEAKLWVLRSTASRALAENMVVGKDAETCRLALNYAEEELRTKFGRTI